MTMMDALSVVTYVSLVWIIVQRIKASKDFPTDKEILNRTVINCGAREDEPEIEQKEITIIPGLNKEINARPEPEIVVVAPQVIGSAYEGQTNIW